MNTIGKRYGILAVCSALLIALDQWAKSMAYSTLRVNGPLVQMCIRDSRGCDPEPERDPGIPACLRKGNDDDRSERRRRGRKSKIF